MDAGKLEKLCNELYFLSRDERKVSNDASDLSFCLDNGHFNAPITESIEFAIKAINEAADAAAKSSTAAELTADAICLMATDQASISVLNLFKASVLAPL